MRLYGADITGSLQITGSISLSGSFKDQESSPGTAGQVLSSTVSGSQWVDVGGSGIGDVTKTGTIVANQIAIWNNTTNQLRSDPTFVIDSNYKITLYQPRVSGGSSNIDSYNIGGGNLANVTGGNNAGFGNNNLFNITTGQQNTAFGNQSLYNNTEGLLNTAIGHTALYSNTTGGNNIAIGNQALYSNTEGSNNIGIGVFSVLSNITGIKNIGIGRNSLSSTTGDGNIAIGFEAGKNITTGDNNVIIGTNTGSTIATSDNNIIISDGSGNNRIQVDSGGIVGIGSTGIFAGTNAILNLQGSGIALKNDRNGSNNNWSYIQNDGTGNESTIILSTGNAIPAMKLAHNGNVGIGVAPNATTKVEVNIINSSNITAVPPLLTLKNVGAAHVAKFVLGDGTTSDTFITHTGGNSVADQKFGIGINATNKFVLDGNGNVGIGTDSPSSKLDITATRTAQLTLIELSTNTLSSGVDDEISIDFGRGLLDKYSARISGYISNFSTYDGGLKFYTSSGGTLNTTPQLTISSGGAATFASTISLGEMATIIVSDINTGENRGLKLENTGAGGKTWNVTPGLTGVNNSNFTIRNATDNINALTISSGGAASFSGSVTADGGMVINGNAGLTANNYGSGKNSSFLSSHASQPQGILIHYTAASPNATGNLFIECKDTSTQRFTVRSNGGVANYSGNNVNLSDESVKKNITDTPNSLDIIKNLEVKDFQYIDQTDNKIHTGVIAQQVLKTDPSLVDQSEELKMVYNTDLMFKMLKAIQEQQTIIEDLTLRIQTLEG